jgi:hypothetical protein
MRGHTGPSNPPPPAPPLPPLPGTSLGKPRTAQQRRISSVVDLEGCGASAPAFSSRPCCGAASTVGGVVLAGLIWAQMWSGMLQRLHVAGHVANPMVACGGAHGLYLQHEDAWGNGPGHGGGSLHLFHWRRSAILRLVVSELVISHLVLTVSRVGATAAEN